MTPVIILLLSVILLMFLWFVDNACSSDDKALTFLGLVIIIVCTYGICYQTQTSTPTPTQPSFQIHTIHGVEYAQINGAVYVRNNSLEIEMVGVRIKEK